MRWEDLKQSFSDGLVLTKYIVEGTIRTPIGKSVKIRTIWIIEKDGINPVFVTAYPV